MSETKRAAHIVCLLAILITCPLSVVRADEPVKTNVEVAKTLTNEVVDELLSSIPRDIETREVWLEPRGNDERYQFVSNCFTGTLTAKGIRAHDRGAAVVTDSTGLYTGWDIGQSEPTLEFHVLDFNLRYTKIYRSFLIGGKKVKRRADVSLLAKLVDPADGLVVWQGEASRTFEDQFSYSKLPEVEAGLYDFSKPPRDSRSWGKIIEPIAVSGIIVGLIYLFFSNQSGD
ncbi:MAG: hypothetical protein JSW58_06230 [Candidatus Latescibacterota bacterium]|nr:MAG: hypothetical protein JSW58_06230 [Candidatus Latescibacterota bacterium]